MKDIGAEALTAAEREVLDHAGKRMQPRDPNAAGAILAVDDDELRVQLEIELLQVYLAGPNPLLPGAPEGEITWRERAADLHTRLVAWRDNARKHYRPPPGDAGNM